MKERICIAMITNMFAVMVSSWLAAEHAKGWIFWYLLALILLAIGANASLLRRLGRDDSNER